MIYNFKGGLNFICNEIIQQTDGKLLGLNGYLMGLAFLFVYF